MRAPRSPSLSSSLWAVPFLLLLATSATAQGAPEHAISTRGTPGYHPWQPTSRGVRTIDVRAIAQPGAMVSEPVEQPDFWSLDEIHAGAKAVPSSTEPALRTGLPAGWVQRGGVVLPEDIALGQREVDPGVIFAVQNIPGNKYPRKHTLFLNFNGGPLQPGGDNSAENKSSLARAGTYPTFPGNETLALAIIQAVQNDLEPYGVRVLYDRRPSKTLPYTMEMMGGEWSDTNIDSPAGGVAPGADCGALGQRHVVYTFNSGASVTQWANTASQEAGHAWGLDHTTDCSSVMSYCNFGNDGSFRQGCAPLCEEACQGPNSAGCRLTHEIFCGEGTDTQDDHVEMQWLFGGNEPDLEPPTVEIQSPTDGQAFAAGDTVQVRAVVDDNYGGFGWKFVVENAAGEVIIDQPDYDREVEPETYRAALNIAGLPDGTYTISVEAEDHGDHVTTESVTIVVGSGSGVATSGDAGSDSGTGDPIGASEESGGTTGEPELDGEEQGCACSATGGGRRGPWASLMAVTLLYGLRLRHARKRRIA